MVAVGLPYPHFSTPPLLPPTPSPQHPTTNNTTPPHLSTPPRLNMAGVPSKKIRLSAPAALGTSTARALNTYCMKRDTRTM